LLLVALSAGAAPPRPRVIVVGWDGADWALLDPLAAQGSLPNLAALVARGRSWNLETYQPIASPLIWTTLATGRTPVDHGVADFQENDVKTRLKIPISGRSRRVPALWNVASARGVSVGVVGWWATWPAEKVKGFLVSDRAAPVLFDPETLSRSPALTWPDGLGEGVRIVTRREGAPGFDEISRYLKISRAEWDVAMAGKKDLENAVTGTQKILGSTKVYARIALDLYDREKPELLMVYFEGTDEIGHLLGRYHPPRLPDVPDEEFRKYSGGVTAFYREADRILGELMKRADADGATLVLMSDHGFKWGANRPKSVSSPQFETAFLWHRSPGILAAAGPGIVAAKPRGKATVFDVVPTLCRLLGLPPDPAFEGKPLAGTAAKAAPAAVAAVPWTKTFPVERLVVTAETDRRAAEEFSKKLISLGYLTGAEASAVDARPPDRAGTETAGAFQNIATFLRLRGKAEESIGWYRKALEVNPKSPATWNNLSHAYLALKRWDAADDALTKAVANGHFDAEGLIYARTDLYKGRPAQLVSFLKRLVAEAPDRDLPKLLLGQALFQAGNCAGADALFSEVVRKRPTDREALNLNALSSWCLDRSADATALFRRSLAVDPNQPIVRNGLSDLERGGTFPK